ncbi:esterase/lipase family protein [Nocardioides sambongensis]|uniref:esterase/lipase family protein n=1 Tax=Nocardioides sambongensis TaxID=2589074 RepID=UPI0015E86482|nr:alpha/beta fold hydrolase [Nocardioides sambongensis]
MTDVTQIMASFLMPDGYGRPPLAALLKEGTLVGEAGRLAVHRSAGRRARRRSSYTQRAVARRTDPVLLVPGFLAGDWTMAALARSLRDQGYRTYRSGIHANVGCVLDAAALVEARLEHIAARRDAKVQIVGHSLGGMIARGIAVRRPDLVAGIVTLGSPMKAPAAHHALLSGGVRTLGRLSDLGTPGLMSSECVAGACAEAAFTESQLPPEGVLMTNIYSKGDGIVDWRACIDPEGRAVQVKGSHIGLVVDPRVTGRVLEALALQASVAPAALHVAGSATA